GGDPRQTGASMTVPVVLVSVVAAAAVLGLTVRARELARSARASDLARDEAMKLAAAARGERDARDAILSGLEDGVVLFDPDGSVVFQNQRAGRLLGSPADRAPRLAPESLRQLVDSARGNAEPREAEVAGPQGRSVRPVGRGRGRATPRPGRGGGTAARRARERAHGRARVRTGPQPDDPKPRPERGAVHQARWPDRRARGRGGRRGGPHDLRLGGRHPGARAAPHLRALLSRGPRPIAGDRRDRVGPVHRQARGGEPGGRDRGAERARTGIDVHSSPPALALGPTFYPSRVTVLLLIRHAVTDVTGKRLSGRTPGIHLSPE